MGLVRQRAWSGVYPWPAGKRVAPLPRGFSGLGMPVPPAVVASQLAAKTSASVLPWYCDLPGFISDRFESCIPSAAQQVELMKQNYGPAATQETIDAGTSDFSQYLEDTGYDQQIAGLKAQDQQAGVNYGLLIAGALVFGVAAVALGSGSSRRYGR